MVPKYFQPKYKTFPFEKIIAFERTATATPSVTPSATTTSSTTPSAPPKATHQNKKIQIPAKQMKQLQQQAKKGKNEVLLNDMHHQLENIKNNKKDRYLFTSPLDKITQEELDNYKNKFINLLQFLIDNIIKIYKEVLNVYKIDNTINRNKNNNTTRNNTTNINNNTNKQNKTSRNNNKTTRNNSNKKNNDRKEMLQKINRAIEIEQDPIKKSRYIQLRSEMEIN